MGKFDLWGGVFNKVKNVDEEILIHNVDVMDTLNTMTKQIHKNAPIITDQKAIVTYLRDNYSQEEIANLFIQQPEVLELVQRDKKRIAESRGRLESWQEHIELDAKDFEKLFESPPESLDEFSREWLRKTKKGRLSVYLNNLGFGVNDNRDEVKGKVTKLKTDFMGEYIDTIERTGYFDPKEWGTHKDK